MRGCVCVPMNVCAWVCVCVCMHEGIVCLCLGVTFIQKHLRQQTESHDISSLLTVPEFLAKCASQVHFQHTTGTTSSNSRPCVPLDTPITRTVTQIRGFSRCWGSGPPLPRPRLLNGRKEEGSRDKTGCL